MIFVEILIYVSSLKLSRMVSSVFYDLDWILMARHPGILSAVIFL